MSTGKLGLLVLALYTSHSMANGVEFCPNLSAISHLNGTYTAATVSGRGEWFGELPGPEQGALVKFDSARFLPNYNTKVGTLNKCTYQTAGGKTVDLRYRPQVAPDVRVQLQRIENWEEKSGPFGIPYFECNSPVEMACAFSEARF